MKRREIAALGILFHPPSHPQLPPAETPLLNQTLAGRFTSLVALGTVTLLLRIQLPRHQQATDLYLLGLARKSVAELFAEKSVERNLVVMI